MCVASALVFCITLVSAFILEVPDAVAVGEAAQIKIRLILPLDPTHVRLDLLSAEGHRVNVTPNVTVAPTVDISIPPVPDRCALSSAKVRRRDAELHRPSPSVWQMYASDADSE